MKSMATDLFGREKQTHKSFFTNGFTQRPTLWLLCCALPMWLIPVLGYAQTPTLGTYPATTVIAGQNATVTPGATPTNTVRATARTNTNFTGVLSVNPTTGVVTMTDAKQAGTYTVTVTAFSSSGTTTTRSFPPQRKQPGQCGRFQPPHDCGDG